MGKQVGDRDSGAAAARAKGGSKEGRDGMGERVRENRKERREA